jgi:S-adenosylmethionine-diacylglycerol 3-amino-3-carboxypropyl transferase
MINNVNFNMIRYANCWEDADILSQALAIKKGDRILSIASAGDNSFSLLLNDPELIVAVDVSEVQLFLVELKKACINNLSQSETLKFLGFEDSNTRKKVFEIIKQDLSPEAQAYWTEHFHQIETGIIHEGKFERYFQLFVRKILPWIHSKKTVAALFKTKSAVEQKEFYHKKWNNWRWRLLFKIFFSKPVMGKFGRDPEFLKQVDVNVSNYIFERAGRELSSTRMFHNFILRYNLTAGFGKTLPHYLQAENYEKIKATISSLVIFKGFAEDAISTYGKFDAMNLSNIFEYLDVETFKKVAGTLKEGLSPQGRMAYWNLMVPRKISGFFPSEINSLSDLSETLQQNDKGFFYSNFIIEQKK